MTSCALVIIVLSIPADGSGRQINYSALGLTGGELSPPLEPSLGLGEIRALAAHQSDALLTTAAEAIDRTDLS